MAKDVTASRKKRFNLSAKLKTWFCFRETSVAVIDSILPKNKETDGESERRHGRTVGVQTDVTWLEQIKLIEEQRESKTKKYSIDDSKLQANESEHVNKDESQIPQRLCGDKDEVKNTNVNNKLDASDEQVYQKNFPVAGIEESNLFDDDTRRSLYDNIRWKEEKTQQSYKNNYRQLTHEFHGNNEISDKSIYGKSEEEHIGLANNATELASSNDYSSNELEDDANMSDDLGKLPCSNKMLTKEMRIMSPEIKKLYMNLAKEDDAYFERAAPVVGIPNIPENFPSPNMKVVSRGRQMFFDRGSSYTAMGKVPEQNTSNQGLEFDQAASSETTSLSYVELMKINKEKDKRHTTASERHSYQNTFDSYENPIRLRNQFPCVSGMNTANYHKRFSYVDQRQINNREQFCPQNEVYYSRPQPRTATYIANRVFNACTKATLAVSPTPTSLSPRGVRYGQNNCSLKWSNHEMTRSLLKQPPLRDSDTRYKVQKFKSDGMCQPMPYQQRSNSQLLRDNDGRIRAENCISKKKYIPMSWPHKSNNSPSTDSSTKNCMGNYISQERYIPTPYPQGINSPILRNSSAINSLQHYISKEGYGPTQYPQSCNKPTITYNGASNRVYSCITQERYVPTPYPQSRNSLASMCTLQERQHNLIGKNTKERSICSLSQDNNISTEEHKLTVEQRVVSGEVKESDCTGSEYLRYAQHYENKISDGDDKQTVGAVKNKCNDETENLRNSGSSREDIYPQAAKGTRLKYNEESELGTEYYHEVSGYNTPTLYNKFDRDDGRASRSEQGLKSKPTFARDSNVKSNLRMGSEKSNNEEAMISRYVEKRVTDPRKFGSLAHIRQIKGDNLLARRRLRNTKSKVNSWNTSAETNREKQERREKLPSWLQPTTKSQQTLGNKTTDIRQQSTRKQPKPPDKKRKPLMAMTKDGLMYATYTYV